MSVVSTPATGQIGAVARAVMAMAAWLATVLVTALVSWPWPGTEVLAPVVVLVTVLVVTVFGGATGGALALASVTILAMTVWGPMGGVVLVSATILAVTALPVRRWEMA
ncbi:hypothetical protein B0I32_106206 [Nonomuraea fuscirosea]|uniref:Uncharacterized protein n=1 Tax=Nonomuraea fuscirosea TaxID=1291556 RepID=A0A2T0N255_9ACTN|nr:hypothetical protein [Nonomuraea fuscirosea]PRX66070.1 hypothetical protein B0I32_106206 [Nonomuraea fuscirosea]